MAGDPATRPASAADVRQRTARSCRRLARGAAVDDMVHPGGHRRPGRIRISGDRDATAPVHADADATDTADAGDEVPAARRDAGARLRANA